MTTSKIPAINLSREDECGHLLNQTKRVPPFRSSAENTSKRLLKRNKRIAIVIPALNEEGAIHQLLGELPMDEAEWIIVVDNGSTDDTATVAKTGGALVASEPVRGYGRACLKGFSTACELGAEIVVFMDGDGSDDPADLPMMLAPVVEGKAEMTIGSRVSQRAERGAIPPQARLGNWLVSHMLRLLYGAQVHDIGSFRVVNCEVLQALHMREMTFGWPVEMLVKMARAHYRVIELPIHYRRRSHGRSKVAGTIAGSLKAAYFMLSTTLRYAWGQGDTHV
ncbi:MAG TPA: glycosyltransferase family 2 protein [Ktedonobacteraceae bacterium]|nr:glycosyltransferase family 2 protein [Ktedonobacteraceae bacterium]